MYKRQVLILSEGIGVTGIILAVNWGTGVSTDPNIDFTVIVTVYTVWILRYTVIIWLPTVAVTVAGLDDEFILKLDIVFGICKRNITVPWPS